MNKQQTLGLLLATYVYNCTATTVTTGDYVKKNRSHEICTASQFDYVVDEIAPASDLTLIVNRIYSELSRTSRTTRQTPGSGAGSGEPWYKIIFKSMITPSPDSANPGSGAGYGEPWYRTIPKSMVTPHLHSKKMPTIYYDDDDEDYPMEHQPYGSETWGSDELPEKTMPARTGPPASVLLILPKSDIPYLMSGPIKINHYTLKICSPFEKDDGSEKSFANVKPALVKIITDPVIDAPPLFAVTGTGQLSISGITLDATDIRIRSSLIYAENTKIFIDWSDIILTSLKSSQSDKSILGLQGDASDFLVKISNSRLYNGISKGKLIMPDPPTPGKLNAEAIISVSNSRAYLTEEAPGLKTGSFEEIATSGYAEYTSASPGFYAYVMKNCPHRPWYLMSGNDGDGNMLERINDTDCMKADNNDPTSNFSTRQEKNGSASGKRYRTFTLLLVATATFLSNR